MALGKLLIFPIFFCCALLVKSDAVSQESGKDEDYFPLISSVLDYLNSNPNRVYDYKRGSLLNAQNKGDVVELSVEVEVNCNNRYPDIPCNEHTLICNSFVGRNPAQPDTYHVLSDVRCSPKIEITMEEMDVSKSVAPMAFGEQNLGGGKIELSNEALTPGQESADFLAVRRDNVPCLGCAFDLHTDAEGVDELINTAVKHIESERNNRHKITNVRRLQQQVVAGLKYILLADVAQTTCSKDADVSAPCILDTSVDPFICEVTFIQKPWISSSKHVIKNNCTLSQEFEPVGHSRQDRDDINNEVIPNKDNPIPDVNPKPNVPNYDDMAQSGNIEESMDADRLADLESQILFGDMFEAPTKIERPQNLAPPHIMQEEYDTADEPYSVPTDVDSLRIEPLNSDRPSELSTLFVSMPVVSEEEPAVMMYFPENEEYVHTPSDHFLPNIRSTVDSFQFGNYLSPHERLIRELNGDSDSDSDSSEENKDGKKVIIKRKVRNTSEDSSSNDTEENKKVKKDTSEKSSESKDKSNSSSDSSSEEKKKKSGKGREGIETTTIENVDLVKREIANTSEEDSVSKDSSEDHKRTKRDTSEEDSDSKNTSEENKRTKRDTSEEDSDSKNTSEEKKRPKRDTSEEDSDSKNTSEENKRPKRDTSEEDSDSKNTSEEKKRTKRDTSEEDSDSKNTSEGNSDSKDTSEEKKRPKRDTSEEESDSKNTSEEKKRTKRDTSEEDSDSKSTSEENKRTKRDTSEEDSDSKSTSEDKKRVKRDTNNDSSSSSSSSESKDKTEERAAKLKAKSNGSDSSSSSSESEDKTEKKDSDKDNLRKKSDDTSESSSSSDDTSEEKKNRNKRRTIEDFNEVRRVRSVGQLEKISPDEKVIVRDLADFAAATLDNIDDDHHKRVILQILGAKKLKLDGIYYQIILRLGISHCHEYEHHENCREKLFTNLTKICKVQVHVEDDYSNPKVVKSQCQNIKKDENDRNRTNYSRYRRAVLVGGNAPMSTNHPSVKKFLSATLEHLDSVSDHPNKHKTVNVISATSQVVAGARYIVTAQIGLSTCKKSEDKLPETCDLLDSPEPETCKIDVWDRPWLNKTIYTITCNDKVYSFGDDNHSRIKRQLVGGESPLDESLVQDYVQKALLHLDSVSNESNKFIAEKVLYVTTQVVAGSLVRIRVRITVSDCPKGSNSTNCAKLEGSQSMNCKFKIWEQPWLNFTETTVKCEDKPKLTFKSKREIRGWNRPQLIDVDEYHHPSSNRKASTIVREALFYLSSKTDTNYNLLNLTDVFRHSTQERQFWVIEAEIGQCRFWKVQNKNFCDKIFNCQFRALESNELIDSLKINITCANDYQVYIYEPVKKLDDNYQALEMAFRQFAKKYNKVYNDEAEFQFRLKVFRDNLNKIALLNKYELGTARYGVTKYADFTEKEFSQGHGYRPDLRKETELPFAQASIPRIQLPTGFDWRSKGAVSKVKNQGFCGSCWAFSVTGNVEGQYAIKHGNLLEFSEQELVDCDKTDQGCNGGLMDNAYRSIEKLGGLETESDYPYEGDDETCHFNLNKVQVQLTGAVNISHNETDMAKWLVQNGPISIAINANAMQFYFGGVSHPWKSLCNPNSLDHGVLIVGYGVDKFALLNKTIPYWIVKNSWGTSWGEQGYYRVYRGDGTCGLNQTPSSAIVA